MAFLHLATDSKRDWENFLSDTRSLISIPSALQRSWARALSHKVKPEGIAEEPIYTQKVITERREALAPLMQVLSERLLPMIQTLSSQHFKLLFSDKDGVILQEWGGGEFAETAQKARLISGSLWSEGIRGTNAIGTAIAENCPVAVEGSAHFIEPNHSLVCYATPVYEPGGELLGVLDATSFAKAAHPSVMTAVLAAAHTLEEWLRFQNRERYSTMRTSVLERLLENFSGPALLVSPRGHIRNANQHALTLFPALRSLALQGSATLSPFIPDIQALLGPGTLGLLHPSNREKYIELNDSLRFRLEVETLYDSPDSPLVVFFEKISTSTSQSTPSVSFGKHDKEGPFSGLLGHDPDFVQTLQKASRLARSKLPLLLFSETGTGKELLARAIHQASPRAKQPFVALNCAALSPQLLASELFGYAPNAFTGASSKGKEGHIACANGGTLFLDEIAETPPAFQAMLLRLLEDGSYYRVGDTALKRADVRILCATCRDLEVLIDEGSFRRDLFYRIRGTILSMPPVRLRTDFSILVDGLLRKIAQELELVETPSLTPEAMKRLQMHDWPGNVRELRHVLYCAAVLAMPGLTLSVQHFEDALPSPGLPKLVQQSLPGSESIAESKLSLIHKALEQTKGNVSAAARKLGVARSTIYRMLRRQEKE